MRPITEVRADKYLSQISQDYKIWIEGYELEKVYIRKDSNWNLYVMANDKRKMILSVPKIGKQCSTSFFGDADYLEGYLAGKFTWQKGPVKYTLINFKN